MGPEPLERVLDELAGPSPAPGGGSAAALTGGIAASLVSMAARIAVARKRRAAESLEPVIAESERLRKDLVELAGRDADAFRGVVAAMKRARGAPAGDPEARAAVAGALEAAARVPLEVARACRAIAAAAAGLQRAGLGGCAVDARVAELLARAALQGAAINVRANLEHELIDPAVAESLERELAEAVAEAGVEVEGGSGMVQERKSERRRALIVVDCLVDFMQPEGKLFVGRAGRNIIPACRRELDRARAQGDKVVFLCDVHTPDDRELAMFPPHCVEGSGGEKVVPELAAGPAEVIVPKRRFSGFFGTGLDLALREAGVTDLTLIGVCTNICVLYTCADARMRGYEVEVVRDAVASFDEGAHGWALGQMQSVLGARIR